MMIIVIIKRPEIKYIQDLKKWILIYGRRKTGKTFIVENFIQSDDYLFVNRNSTIFSKKMNKTIDISALEILITNIKGTLVIDEFQRLNDSFLDFLQRVEQKGRLILLSSTLFMAKKIFNANSPILGFFAEFRFSLIQLPSVLKELNGSDPVKNFELAILLREPIAIEYYNTELKSSENFTNVLYYSLRTIPALVGEIFIEEERSLSKTYEGVFRAIASGKRVTTKISSFLFKHKLILKDDPSLIQPYLTILMELGIIKRIKDIKKNRYYYFHVSPLAELFYYADEKYSIANRDVTTKQIEQIIAERLPHLVESQLRESLAKTFDLSEFLFQTPTMEYDGVLTRLKRVVLVLEVKWKNIITKKELLSLFQKFNGIQSQKYIIVVKKLPKFLSTISIPEKIEIWDIAKVISTITKGG